MKAAGQISGSAAVPAASSISSGQEARAPSDVDVLVVGGGPAGSACALRLARAGCSVAVIERESFPREKVCGDCLNPAAWHVLRGLGVEEEMESLPGIDVRSVEFESLDGRVLRTAIPPGARGPRAIRRSLLDAALLGAAARAGAAVHHGAAVNAVRRDGEAWVVEAGGRSLRARFLVAADGRNSTTLRLAGVSAPGPRDARIGLHAHLPRGDFAPDAVRMFWRPEGYGGIAPVDDAHINVALAIRADGAEAVKRWASVRLPGGGAAQWRAFAPLERPPVPPARADGLFLAGDAARVVEPFTGEGIYYALATGEMIGLALAGHLRERAPLPEVVAAVNARQNALYRGRLWWNTLARWFGMHPRVAGWLLRYSTFSPGWLALLTRKVTVR